MGSGHSKAGFGRQWLKPATLGQIFLFFRRIFPLQCRIAVGEAAKAFDHRQMLTGIFQPFRVVAIGFEQRHAIFLGPRRPQANLLSF